MGTVFRKTVTRPLPQGAETFTRKGERWARWKDRKGKTRTASLTIGQDGTERISVESPCYVAKYRDGAGVVRVVSTGCKDETAARQVLADLERKSELVRSGVMSATEAAIGRHQGTPLDDHIAAYLTYLESAGACGEHRTERRRQLRCIARNCGFSRLADLERGALESWLAQQARNGMGARTRNSYLAAALAFGNWCADKNVRRLTSNPFEGIVKANEKADPRRLRRAMTQAELVRLLDVARQRPLLDALTVRKGKRKGERYAKVRPEVRERLELLGRERALIYKTLVLTGLRKGELASLTVGQLHLDEPVPFAALDAADEKNRQGNEIPLRDDLAADMQDWLSFKLERLQAEALERGEPIPARLPADSLVFTVPDKLCKILNRDLKLAGIPKRDEDPQRFPVQLVAPSVAPTTDNSCPPLSTCDKTYTDGPHSKSDRLIAVSGMPDKRKEPLTTPVSGSASMGATGLEPVTPSLSKCSGQRAATGFSPINPRTHAQNTPGKSILQARAKNCEKMRIIAA
jgi:integrase